MYYFTVSKDELDKLSADATIVGCTYTPDGAIIIRDVNAGFGVAAAQSDWDSANTFTPEPDPDPEPDSDEVLLQRILARPELIAKLKEALA